MSAVDLRNDKAAPLGRIYRSIQPQTNRLHIVVFKRSTLLPVHGGCNLLDLMAVPETGRVFTICQVCRERIQEPAIG